MRRGELRVGLIGFVELAGADVVVGEQTGPGFTVARDPRRSDGRSARRRQHRSDGGRDRRGWREPSGSWGRLRQRPSSAPARLADLLFVGVVRRG